ncbi:MAG TPA: DMT family transporter [Candidatus Dormibacteraeota bacterium]|nr:DMT family transporter [Candidatus Dormibacteraeota bacterium]
MGVVLALAAAAIYGTGDFFGGLSAKRSSVWAVAVISQAVGGLGILAAVILHGDAVPPLRELALAGVGGVAGGLGIVLLYRGLAVGRMSIVAPVTGVVAAALPVVVGLARGERAAWFVWVGVAITVAAVVLVSASPDEHLPDGAPAPRASGLPEALGAGAGFGLLYVVFSVLGATSPLWPIVAARAASVPLLALAALVARGSLRPAPRALGTIALAGVCDVSANVLYLLSLRQTLLAVAAVVTSLYPASTVLLARIVLRERLSRLQWVGVACAAVGVTLIALR